MLSFTMLPGSGPPKLWLLCVAAVTLLCQTVLAQRALMSVDLGGEFMKIAVVKPGVPMEIVLNKESGRKTRSIVAFRDGHRQFANEAYSTAVRFPDKAFWFVTHLIGRNYNDPLVEQFLTRFPYYRDVMLKDEERGTILFKQSDGTVHSCEELLAMLLEKAKEYAKDFAGQEITEAVVTVPPYFTQAERRAVIRAADLVGLGVLQLMTDAAAVALNYGVFRRKNFNTSVQHYMFYDMGATSTVVSVVGYKMVKTQVGDRLESNPQLTVKGVGYDRSLGGLEMTLRLRDHLAQVFNEQQQKKKGAGAGRVQDSPRAMATLLNEAERVKKVLSANTQHMAQVEGLLDGEDLKITVTRDQYLSLIADLLDRVTKPVDDALKASEITWPEISEIILMGGGSRLPKVHDILLKHSGKKELGKSINTDEAAALGAVYQAAYLGTGFKVKTFHVRDANLFPINVEFEKQKTEDEETAGTKKIKRTLFGRANYYPQKKVMTFNKHYVKDFNFDVRYAELDFLSEEERNVVSPSLLTRVGLKGVDKALAKKGGAVKVKAGEEEPGVHYRGVKAHFRLDNSGLLHLDLVEAAFEDTTKDDSTWSKLGKTIGSMFGGSEKEGADKPETDTAGNGKKDTASQKGKEKEKEEKKKKEKKADKSKDKKAAEKGLNEKLKSIVKVKDFNDLAKEKFSQAKRRLVDLRRRDEERVAVQEAKNELEGYIIDAQDKLYQDNVEQCSTEQERFDIRQKLSEASDWLYEQPDTAKRVLFTKKLREVKGLLKSVETRVREREDRPKATRELKKMLSKAADFLQEASLNNSKAETLPPYTSTELFMLERLINETKDWLEASQKEQKQKGDQADPSLLTSDLQAKVKALEREVRYLKNKPKRPKEASSSSSKKKAKAKSKEEKKTESNDGDENADNKKRTDGSDDDKNGGDDSVDDKNEKKEEEEKVKKTGDDDDDDDDATVEVETDEAFNAAQRDEEALKGDTHTDSSHIEL